MISLIICLGVTVFEFNGADSSVIDLSTTLQCVQGNNPRSISFMIETTATNTGMIIWTGNSGTEYNNFRIEFNFNGLSVIQFDASGVAYLPSTGKVINDGLWHTVLVTYDGITLKIYVDGILDNTATNWNDGSTATIASTLNTIGNNANY